MGQHDQAWGLLAAAGHPEESAGAESGEFPRAEDFTANAGGSSHRPRAAGQLGRGEGVAGFVHQVAGGVGGLCQNPAAAYRVGHGLEVLTVSFDQGDALDRLAGVVGRPVARETVETEQRALDHRLRRLSDIESSDACAVDDTADAAGAGLSKCAGGFARRGADPVQRQFLGLTQAHHQDPLCPEPSQSMDQRLLAPLAGRLSRLDEPRDRPTQRGVHRGRRATERRPAAQPSAAARRARRADAFEQIDDESIARERRYIPDAHTDIHV